MDPSSAPNNVTFSQKALRGVSAETNPNPAATGNSSKGNEFHCRLRLHESHDMQNTKRDARSHAIVPLNHHDVIKGPGLVPVVSPTFEFIFTCLRAAIVWIQSDLVRYIFQIVFRRLVGRSMVLLIVTPTRKADEFLMFALEHPDQLRWHMDSSSDESVSVKDTEWAKSAGFFSEKECGLFLREDRSGGATYRWDAE
ncbi:MAG: hypothetical protein ASARMPREDX12_006771 [Alectoria sarmentosa]|nr:MAG: hypothetical protein ASARMPREDX12_006771 [Alectoria sarmentosa]